MSRCSVKMICCSLFFVLLCASGCYGKPKFLAENGSLDLHTCNLENTGPLELKGQWKFYWRRFIRSESDYTQAKPTCLFKLPGSWNGLELGGASLGGSGFGSFVLEVRTNTTATLALKINEINSAYELYVNHMLAGKAGKLGTDRTESIPHFGPRIFEIHPGTEHFLIVLNVSNFHYCKGGPRRTIILGLKDDVIRDHERENVLEVLLFGGLMIMCLYQLILMISYRMTDPFLFFALFCLFIAIYGTVTGNAVISRVFPSLGWSIHIRIVYLSIYFTVPLFLKYLHSIFPEDMSAVFHRIALAATVVLSGYVVIMDPRYFSFALTAFHVLVLAAAIFTIYFFTLLITRKRRGVYILIFGIAAIVLTAVNDVLHHADIINTYDFTPVSVCLLILSHGYLITAKTRKEYGGIKSRAASAGLSPEKRKSLDDVIKYLEQNYRDSISREGLARLAGMHRDNFGRLFKQHTGKRFGDIINELRIAEAVELLRKTDSTILDIALAVGFENLRTFNRVFRKIKGISPGEFRSH